MDVTVSGRHVDITPAMKEYAVKRVSKLSKYFVRTEKVHVTLNVEGARHWAELVLSPGKGAPLIVAAGQSRPQWRSPSLPGLSHPIWSTFGRGI